MKRFLLLIAACAFWNCGLLSAQSIVQSVNSSEASSWPTVCGGGMNIACSTTPNFGSSVTVGNYILASPVACENLGCTSSSEDVGSVTDTLGNTFSLCSKVSGMRVRTVEIWYGKVTTGGTDAVTIAATNSGTTFSYGGAYAIEVSGLAATSPCDGAGSFQGTIASMQFTVSTASSLSVSGEFSNILYETAGTPCSVVPSGYSTGTIYFSKILSSTAMENATFTGCTNGDVIEAVIATFVPFTAPSPTGFRVKRKKLLR